MAKRKRIKSSRKECNIMIFRQIHISAAKLVFRNKSIYMIQRSRIRKEIHIILFYICYQSQNLLICLPENIKLFFLRKFFCSENILTCNHDCFLTDHFMIIGKPLKQHPQHLCLATLIFYLRLNILISIRRIFFYNFSYGIQCY